jgi:hypothetical protein
MPLPLIALPAAIALAGTGGYVVYKKRKAKQAADVYSTEPITPGPKGMSDALKKAYDDAMALPNNALTQSEWLQLSDQFSKLGYATESMNLGMKAQQAPITKAEVMSDALKKVFDDAMAKPVTAMLKSQWLDLSNQFSQAGFSDASMKLGLKAQSAPTATPLPKDLQPVYDFAMKSANGYYFLIRLSELFSRLGYAQQSADIGIHAHDFSSTPDNVIGRSKLSSVQTYIDHVKTGTYSENVNKIVSSLWVSKAYSIASILQLAVINRSLQIPLPPNNTESTVPLKV